MIKRIAIALAMLLASTQSAFAACSGTVQACTTTVWEVRPTNGDNTQGGCFDSTGTGTDYTQQDSAQLSATDLATSGAGVTTVTSATGGFTAAMVGNCLRINSGTNFTVGWYLITGHTDTNTITVAVTPTSAGAGSGGNGKIGGATASIDSQTTQTIGDIFDNGHIAWVKNEAGWTEAITFDNAASSTQPGIIEAYNTSRDDDPTGSNRTTLDRNSAAGIALTFGSTAFFIFRNLIVREAAGGGADSTTQLTSTVFQNCRFTANGAGGIENAGTRSWTLILNESEFDNNSQEGIQNESTNNDNSTIGDNVYIHDNTNEGIRSEHIRFLIAAIDTNGTDGVTADSTITFNHVTIYNSGDDGIDFDDSDGIRLVNTIIDTSGGYGFNGIAGTDADFNTFFRNNVYSNSTIGASNNHTLNATESTTAPGFTDAANGDFSIGSTFDDAGYPTTIEGSATTAHIEPGASMYEETAGGGASAHTFVQ